MTDYYDRVAAVFDRAAAGYQGDYAANPIMAWLEEDTFGQLCRLFPAGSRLLEIGCGPGTMAVRLAEAGRAVVACDISPAMIAQAERRAALSPAQTRLTWLVAPAGEIGARVQGPFDGAYSNFGPLNCEPDLARFAASLAHLLRPGAAFLSSVMNRTCAWEIVWGVGRLRMREAFRRFGRGWQIAHMSAGPGEPATEFPVRFYSPREFAAILKPYFRTERIAGYPVIIPPPYLAYRLPRALDRLKGIERRYRRLPGLRGLGDHFLIVMRRHNTIQTSAPPLKSTALSLLACPLCGGPLLLSGPNAACAADGALYPQHAAGLLDLRPPDSRASADAFAGAYRAARLADGWQPLGREAALALPEGNPPGSTRLYWQVRRESWLALCQLLTELGPGSRVLADAGAGFPWLSHRLATLGHRVVAFDLRGDADLGLGAARLYAEMLASEWLSDPRIARRDVGFEAPAGCASAKPPEGSNPDGAFSSALRPGRFLPVLGSLEEPPLAAGSYDAVICNASLHYVNNPSECVTRLARALRPQGALIVVDSPIAASDQHALHPHPGSRALGRQELDLALRSAGLTPQWRRVRRGWLWQRHQLKNWLLRRPRFDFPIVVGRKEAGAE